MIRLEERIKKLEELQHAELVVDEIEAILHVESKERGRIQEPWKKTCVQAPFCEKDSREPRRCLRSEI